MADTPSRVLIVPETNETGTDRFVGDDGTIRARCRNCGERFTTDAEIEWCNETVGLHVDDCREVRLEDAVALLRALQWVDDGQGRSCPCCGGLEGDPTNNTAVPPWFSGHASDCRLAKLLNVPRREG